MMVRAPGSLPQNAISSHVFQVVINCASAMDLNACLALLEGLQKRRKATGRDVHFLHVSVPTVAL